MVVIVVVVPAVVAVVATVVLVTAVIVVVGVVWYPPSMGCMRPQLTLLGPVNCALVAQLVLLGLVPSMDPLGPN